MALKCCDSDLKWTKLGINSLSLSGHKDYHLHFNSWGKNNNTAKYCCALLLQQIFYLVALEQYFSLEPHAVFIDWATKASRQTEEGQTVHKLLYKTETERLDYTTVLWTRGGLSGLKEKKWNSSQVPEMTILWIFTLTNSVKSQEYIKKTETKCLEPAIIGSCVQSLIYLPPMCFTTQLLSKKCTLPWTTQLHKFSFHLKLSRDSFEFT